MRRRIHIGSLAPSAPALAITNAKTKLLIQRVVTHRSAGTGGIDTLTNPEDREALVTFLKSIDAKTQTFP